MTGLMSSDLMEKNNSDTTYMVVSFLMRKERMITLDIHVYIIGLICDLLVDMFSIIVALFLLFKGVMLIKSALLSAINYIYLNMEE